MPVATKQCRIQQSSTMKLLSLLVAAALCWACDGAGRGPTSATAQYLAVVSERLALSVGERMALRAELRRVSGPARSVHARWSVSDRARAAIAQDGSLLGLGVGPVTVTAEHDGLQAQALFAVVADISGTWFGDATIRRCAQLAGPGPSACRFLIGLVHRVELTAVQAGEHVAGGMRMHSCSGFQGACLEVLHGPTPLSGMFEGHLSDDLLVAKATLTLPPSHPWESSSPRYRIDDWRLRLTGNELSTVGEVRVDEESTNIFGPQKLVLFQSVAPLRRAIAGIPSR